MPIVLEGSAPAGPDPVGAAAAALVEAARAHAAEFTPGGLHALLDLALAPLLEAADPEEAGTHTEQMNFHLGEAARGAAPSVGHHAAEAGVHHTMAKIKHADADDHLERAHYHNGEAIRMLQRG